MKRNLFILSLSVLIFSVLMISMVYAGWFGFTGNSVKEFQNSANIDLKEGLANKINLDGEEIFVKAPIIEKDSVMININGEIKEVKKGSPITIGDYEVQFISSEKGFLSRTKSKVKISRKKSDSEMPHTNMNISVGNGTTMFFQHRAQSTPLYGGGFKSFDISCPNLEPIISHSCMVYDYTSNTNFLGSSVVVSNNPNGPEKIRCHYYSNNPNNLDIIISARLICLSN